MNELTIVEHEGQRVLTTQQLAKNYGTEPQVITNNFNRNKEHYQSRIHYFTLEGEEKRQFLCKNQFDFSNKDHSKLYLWTKKGCLLHAKSLGTNKAWEVYEMLVDTYFRAKEQNTSLQNLSPQLQVLINMELRQKELETVVTQTKGELQSIRDIVTLNPNSWREDTKKLITKMARKLGGNEHIRDLRSESYHLLDVRMGVDVQTRLTNKRRRLMEEGVCKSKRDKLNPLDVIVDDKKLIEGYVAIVKDMAVKYGV